MNEKECAKSETYADKVNRVKSDSLERINSYISGELDYVATELGIGADNILLNIETTQHDLCFEGMQKETIRSTKRRATIDIKL